MPDNPVPPMGEIVLYQTEDGHTRLECRFADETLWLSQALMAELFQKDVRTINEHLQNIYDEGEIDPGATIRKFRIVRREGTREVSRGGSALWSPLPGLWLWPKESVEGVLPPSTIPPCPPRHSRSSPGHRADQTPGYRPPGSPAPLRRPSGLCLVEDRRLRGTATCS
jgi:hypothetical protein